jgi:Tfp pilus assembly protein PilE
MRYSRETKTVYRQAKAGGVTLIELLLVVSFMAILSLAMYAVFNNGIKIWQRINKQLPEEDVAIFMDRFSRDLRNNINYKAIKFYGTEKNMEFPTLVNSQRFGNASVGKVAYFYDSGAEVLSRQQDDYAHIYNAEPGPSRYLNNVVSAKFQYYFFDADNKKYLWLEEWNKDNLPLAVRIELEIDDGSQTRKFTQAIFIPLAA